VKALIRGGALPDEAEPQALSAFLLFGFIPSPLTTAKNVHCLLPGHYLVASSDQPSAKIRRYWDLDPQPQTNDAATTDELRHHLARSVAEHLISDVPLGIFLSGGVDSAAIVALAARFGTSPLTTLTVSFGEQKFDESRHALAIARGFHTQHHNVQVTAADFAMEMPVFLAAMDQPTNDGMNTWFVSKAARQCGLKAVLSGLGGDEVFWGYTHYRRAADGSPMRRVLTGLPAFARRGLLGGVALYGSMRGQEKWQRLEVLKNGVSAEGMYYSFRGFFAPDQAARLLGLTSREMNGVLERHVAELRPPGANGCFRASGLNYIEMKRYLHDQLLRDCDVFSMAHSIEVRVPLLDHELVEHCTQLPDKAKLSNRINKPVLVQAVGDKAVTSAAGRKKIGFTLPLEQWMKAKSAELAEMATHPKVLQRRESAKLWHAFQSGRLHWSRAWGLLVLGSRSLS
jgi:asparagine synthase (glutamine-hydrolysing)